MWVTLVSSDGSLFDVNSSGWPSMSVSELPRLLDSSSELFEQGLVRKTAAGLQFNVTASVLRPVVDALQRISMAAMLSSDQKIRALPLQPSVALEVSESFWMFCKLLRLMPYFAHECTQCKPRDKHASIRTSLCPMNVTTNTYHMT